MSHLLLVEDEIELGQAITMALMKMGLDCTWVKTIREARASLAEKIFDLVILDRNLPDGEGTQLLEHPKRQQFCVLILSSKSSVDQRVEGLKRGADDYLPKPFSFKELEARIHALLRRRPVLASNGNGGRPLWTLSEENLNLSCENGIVDLTRLNSNS